MRLVVGRMEALGQVERRPDPADGRGYLVELTAAGRADAAAGRQRRAEWLTQAIGTQLSPQEQDTLRAAVALLDRLVEAGPAQ
jgi:DNA-binding MarR family transcriptional regulator